ncbi:MAG: S8 family serine peptidase [Flavobacteriales bacterium]
MKRICTLLFIFASIVAFSQEAQYLERTLIVKVKQDFRSYCSKTGVQYPGLSQFLDKIKTQEFVKIYPQHVEMHKNYTRNGVAFTDLSLIYRLKYNENVPLEKVIAGLLNIGIFEYAEPSYIFTPLGVPNDPGISNQWHLGKIKAYEAWDITQGDTNVVVGIVDSGIEYTHPDLAQNIKLNYADPVDGLDNDGDGYKDNFRGWDLYGNDNDVAHEATGTRREHGTWVSSEVAEVVNNGNQGAGIGYKTKILPVKASDVNGSIVAGYEGIVYAADHGCSIINASWGSVKSWSQYGQDVIKYAVINKNALVTAAAGNNNDQGLFYPASFDYVISVGGVDTVDKKWDFGVGNGSNYNEFVDILCPSMRIYGTHIGSNFTNLGAATSFAAPMVAAAGALLKSVHPEYSAIQIGEALKNTADRIDTIPFNTTFAGKIGSGRLNVYRAVTVTGIPAFMSTSYQITDNDDNIYHVGDTICLKGTITNFLAASSNAQVTASSASPYLSFINSSMNLGVVANMGEVNFNSNPFTFKVMPGVPNNTEVIVTLIFTDGTYKEIQAFRILLNPSYHNMDINKITMSVGADGRLGFMAANKTTGSGFAYNGGGNYIYEMGFMVSDASANVMFTNDGDFTALNALSVKQPGLESDKDFNGLVNDNGAGGNKIGIEVKHKTLGWNDPGLVDFVIEEYRIKNTSGATLNSVRVGLYVDWDMVNYTTDAATYDTASKIAYAFEYNSNSAYAGTKALTHKYMVNNYSVDCDGFGGSVNLYDVDVFSDAEKKTAMSTSRSMAGVGDIAILLSQGPFTIAAGDSITVAFALIGGSSLNDLITYGNKADSIYTSIRSITASKVTADVKCKGSCDGTASLSTIYGVPPFTYQWNDGANQTSANASGLCAGNYICTVKDAVNNSTQISVDIFEASALLQLTVVDTTAEDGSCNGDAAVLATGGQAPFSYLWDDGSAQTTAMATALCNGTYQAIVTDLFGCKDTVSITIDDVTGIESIGKPDLKVFPNPAVGAVQVKGDFKGAVQMDLYDISGRIIRSQSSSGNGAASFGFDLSAVPAGVYLLRISNDGTYHDTRITVTR